MDQKVRGERVGFGDRYEELPPLDSDLDDGSGSTRRVPTDDTTSSQPRRTDQRNSGANR